MGVTWYTWLEQGRNIPASPQVIGSLARSLRLSADERRHLRDLAGLPPPAPPDPPDEDGLQARLQRLVDAVAPNAASIYDVHFDYLAWNEPYQRIRHDPAGLAAGRRNLLRDGGTLLIGVTDAGVPCGLAGDYASLRRHGKNDRDVFQLHLINIVVSSMGAAAAANVSAQFHTIDGADVCRVHVQPSALPVDAKVSTEKNGQLHKKTAFYVRIGNSTHELSATGKAKYLLNRWPATSPKV